MTAVSPQPFSITGFATRDGNALNNQLGYPTTAYDPAITATPSGTQANSYKITAPLSLITTVTTAADSVLLPPSIAGKTFTILNEGGNNATVFASGTDTINGTAGATGVTQNNSTVTIYFCAAPGKWYSK